MKRFSAILLTLVCLIGFISICAFAFNQPDIVGYDRYVVKYGDTLWDIAKESNGWNKIDGQLIIDDIQEKSDCTALIYPGQIVYIPIYEF